MANLTDFIAQVAECWTCKSRAEYPHGETLERIAINLAETDWRILQVEGGRYILACPKCVDRMEKSGAIEKGAKSE